MWWLAWPSLTLPQLDAKKGGLILSRWCDLARGHLQSKNPDGLQKAPVLFLQ